VCKTGVETVFDAWVDSAVNAANVEESVPKYKRVCQTPGLDFEHEHLVPDTPIRRSELGNVGQSIK